MRIGAQVLAEHDELYNVNPPFPVFDLGYEGLRTPEFLSELLLCYPRILPGLNQKFEEKPVPVRIERFQR